MAETTKTQTQSATQAKAAPKAAEKQRELVPAFNPERNVEIYKSRADEATTAREERLKSMDDGGIDLDLIEATFLALSAPSPEAFDEVIKFATEAKEVCK